MIFSPKLSGKVELDRRPFADLAVNF